MKRCAILWIALAALSGCENGNQVFLGSKCELASDCGGLACINHVCIEPCTATSCMPHQVCLAEGMCIDAAAAQCSVEVACVNPKATCVFGQCELANTQTQTCSVTNPCQGTNQICNAQGICETAISCSKIAPCADTDMVCDPNLNICIPRCTAGSCGNNQICGAAGFCQDRCSGNDCSGNRLCVNGACVDRCDENSCSNGEFCGADGLCVAQCTPTSCSSEMICASSGKCEPKCQAGKCTDGQICGDEGVCINAECSRVEPCKNGKVCSYGTCFDVALISCYHDRECPEGFHCDDLKCVDANSCSMTRTCAGNKICQNGMCVDPVPTACDKQNPCTQPDETCIAGRCVTCHCREDQICTPEGTCIDANISSDGRYVVGAACVWSEFQAFCDKNRQFLCVDGQISATSCGANICTTASEEGLGCHEPCANQDAFYGVCIDLYEYQVAFTHVCEQTPEGYIWTLKHGFEECQVGCTDGRCDFVPKEFGTACTPQSYPDACQGDWLTYCYSVGTASMAAGTLCSLLSDQHFCALPGAELLKKHPEIIATCATACQTKGEISTGCVADADGFEYSMTYICGETTTGVLADFETQYEPCAKGCDPTTGICKK